jgi:hypothetical protein
MVGILAVGFVANLLIRPVADRYHLSTATAEVACVYPGRTAAMNEQTLRMVVSWLLVAALLGYGVAETATTAAKLF